MKALGTCGARREGVETSGEAEEAGRCRLGPAQRATHKRGVQRRDGRWCRPVQDRA